MTEPSALPPDERQRALKGLRTLLIVGIVDGILLIPLVIGVIIDNHDIAPILGPIHGIGFLIEVYLAVQGAQKGWWRWWYVAAITFTGGPPGLAIGHPRVKASIQGAGNQ